MRRPSPAVTIRIVFSGSGAATPDRANVPEPKKQVRYRARTVHLWLRLRPLELALNGKQIPRFIGNNGNASRGWNG